MSILKLGIRPLTLEEIRDVALHGKKVALAPAAVRRVERSHRFLLSRIKKNKPLYGVNTGFGLLSNVRIPDGKIEALQENLLRSHACGVGQPIEDHYARAMLLLRANALIAGNSGVSLKLVRFLIELLNRGVCPLVPEQGSVGASGDLAPLAHLALVLIGEGKARVKGREMGGARALRSAGLKPIQLGPKEGLALINGTQFMTAIGVFALLDAESLCEWADAAGAMTVEALRGTESAFEPEIHVARNQPGQIASAKRVREWLLSGGGKSVIAKSHENCGKVQDPYSLRCIPQVHGATRDVLRFVRGVLEREANAVTDNPLVFPERGKILSGGNFHGQIVAIAMDALSIASSELGSISERRLDKLVNPNFSDLPPFLTRDSGLNSGLMIVQVAAASIVSESKTLCHPASVDSIPTSGDKEDHVSMGAWAARKAARVIANTRKILAMELVGAAQGIELLRPLRSSRGIENLHRRIRRDSAALGRDRSLHEDLARLEKMIATEEATAFIARHS